MKKFYIACNLYAVLMTLPCFAFFDVVPKKDVDAYQEQIHGSKEEQIQQLERAEQDALSKARAASREAERLQFIDWVGYKEKLREAQRYQDAANTIRGKIEELQRHKLLD